MPLLLIRPPATVPYASSATFLVLQSGARYSSGRLSSRDSCTWLLTTGTPASNSCKQRESHKSSTVDSESEDGPVVSGHAIWVSTFDTVGYVMLAEICGHKCTALHDIHKFHSYIDIARDTTQEACARISEQKSLPSRQAWVKESNHFYRLA